MTNLRRVAMTVEQFWHRVPGGTAVATLGMAQALAKRGDVDLVGVAAAHRSPPGPPWKLPIPVRHLPLPRVALYEAWHRLRRPRVERASGPVDVIHATTIAIPPKSAPLVVTVHDLAWLHEPAHFTPRGISFFDRGLKLALKDADLVMCPSTATLEDCAHNGFDRKKLRLVPMGAGARVASYGEIVAAKTKYQLPDRYILWTGTIEPRKNLARLLEAYARLDGEAALVLAGPKGWNEDLDALVKDKRDKVKVIGFVPPSDLGPLYAGADVFCFPSLLEGFGLPVVEAMIQGTPVVTSKGTSTEEIADGAGVLVDPYDVGSIAEGLTRVLDDPDGAERLAAAGRERATHYTWEQTAELVAAVYEEASP